MTLLSLIIKFRKWIAIAVFFLLWLAQIGYTRHLSNNLDKADAECVERINKVNKAYQDALDAWKAKVFIVENELEAERNNIKLEFRDIKHETQKVITERIYSECKLDDAGLSIANKAIDATNSSKSND